LSSPPRREEDPATHPRLHKLTSSKKTFTEPFSRKTALSRSVSAFEESRNWLLKLGPFSQKTSPVQIIIQRQRRHPEKIAGVRRRRRKRQIKNSAARSVGPSTPQGARTRSSVDRTHTVLEGRLQGGFFFVVKFRWSLCLPENLCICYRFWGLLGGSLWARQVTKLARYRPNYGGIVKCAQHSAFPPRAPLQHKVAVTLRMPSKKVAGALRLPSKKMSPSYSWTIMRG